MVLSGCTTYVAEAKKDERYTKRLTETSIVRTSASSLTTRISRSSRGPNASVSAKDIEQSKKNIADLQALFSREFPGLVSAALNNSAVSVRPPGSPAATQLRITPTYSESECIPLGCRDSLWLQVHLFDIQERRTVWSGRFKVGAATVFSTNDVTVVQSFTDNLISQLKSSHLL
jgi:hypothetical protein